MGKTILGGLLGGFALYLVGFIFWGTPLSNLAFSSADPAAAAQLQASMAQALNAGGTGVYIIPDPSTAEGTILFGRGPIAQVFYNSNGYPVTDGEQHVAPGVKVRIHRRARRAIAIAENMRPFQEFVIVRHRPEFLQIDEMIILAVDLAGANGAGGGGHRHGQIGFGLQQFARDGGLARARRR